MAMDTLHNRDCCNDEATTAVKGLRADWERGRGVNGEGQGEFQAQLQLISLSPLQLKVHGFDHGVIIPAPGITQRKFETCRGPGLLLLFCPRAACRLAAEPSPPLPVEGESSLQSRD